MFIVTKRIEIAGAHSLNLPYDSPCGRLHGHNWIIEVEISTNVLNENGMVFDFTDISREVKRLDHQNINDVLKGINPTAEHIAVIIHGRIEAIIQDRYREGKADLSTHVSKVTVQESEGNTACYIP